VLTDSVIVTVAETVPLFPDAVDTDCVEFVDGTSLDADFLLRQAITVIARINSSVKYFITVI
jgi:hypothetical protein